MRIIQTTTLVILVTVFSSINVVPLQAADQAPVPAELSNPKDARAMAVAGAAMVPVILTQDAMDKESIASYQVGLDLAEELSKSTTNPEEVLNILNSNEKLKNATGSVQIVDDYAPDDENRAALAKALTQVTSNPDYAVQGAQHLGQRIISMY